MEQAVSFDSVLEAAETLSLEEKETLIDILSHRVAESNRKLIIAEVREAEEDFLQGRCQETSIDELMKEILA
ncbi:MAG TPA: hypothetical protein PKC13_23405 [Blastocatellia bacterium]|nr:hypothetical protein [Blastocatellia bacterium]HMV86536.1 hypothetical protein [Blastocatellia bacterium]HMX28554.1 hypothetical protein [Blastocatellia bacterium]HMY70609.1 hypothetical protein [Blastocatellia bacterium]HNG31394.1 hypothetical protein [Blastocatellia bacterium]